MKVANIGRARLNVINFKQIHLIITSQQNLQVNKPFNDKYFIKLSAI